MHYSSAFASEETNLLCVVNKRTGKSYASNPINIGVEKYFYAYETPDGNFEKEELEKYYGEQIENPAVPIIDKIRKQENILFEDKETLAKYIHGMLRRVPLAKERLRGLMPGVVDEIQSELYEYLDSTEDEDLASGEKIDEIKSFFEAYAQKHKKNVSSLFLKPDWPGYESHVKRAIHSMNWVFLICPKGSNFITSDNPVFIHKKAGLKKSDLTFPISPSIVLWCTWRRDVADLSWRKIDLNTVKEVNRRTMLNALKEIYSAAKDFQLRALIKKKKFRINQLLFQGPTHTYDPKNW